MMKRMIHTAIGPWLKGLIVWALLLSFAAIPAVAEITQADLTLTPEPLTYEDGNIGLSKQAERIGPDEWRVNVQATVKETPVEIPQIEVTFVLDTSNSMLGCADEKLHAMRNGFHYHDTTCPMGDECVATYINHRGNNYCSLSKKVAISGLF